MLSCYLPPHPLVQEWWQPWRTPYVEVISVCLRSRNIISYSLLMRVLLSDSGSLTQRSLYQGVETLYQWQQLLFSITTIVHQGGGLQWERVSVYTPDIIMIILCYCCYPWSQCFHAQSQVHGPCSYHGGVVSHKGVVLQSALTDVASQGVGLHGGFSCL